jgi:hypothetical protein
VKEVLALLASGIPSITTNSHGFWSEGGFGFIGWEDSSHSSGTTWMKQTFNGSPLISLIFVHVQHLIAQTEGRQSIKSSSYYYP